MHLIATVRTLGVAAALVLLTPLATLAEAGRLTPLFEAMKMNEVLEIMAEEGDAYADAVAKDMFAGADAGGSIWPAEVKRIYDTDRLAELMLKGFGDGPDAETLEVMTSFFSSELGQRITGLEISARRAMLDPEVEKMAEESHAQMVREDDPRLKALARFIEVNDLVDSNVMGGMNSNLAFYRGLVEGGAFPFTMTEDQILSDVWEQEADIRDDTIDWVHSFLAMAYQPLSDGDLETYTAISASEAGQDFNRVLFEAFDVMFNDISYQLGLAAGKVLNGQDI